MNKNNNELQLLEEISKVEIPNSTYDEIWSKIAERKPVPMWVPVSSAACILALIGLNVFVFLHNGTDSDTSIDNLAYNPSEQLYNE